MALTVKQITKLKQPGRYGDGHGLYLQVFSSSNRSWLLRYQRGARERWMGLGPEADFTLEEARERARKARQLIKDGIDPIDERKSKRLQQMTEDAAKAAKAKTFGQVATEYFEFHSPKWKNQKHAAQFLSSLKTYAFPVIGRLPVAAVDKTLVLKVMHVATNSTGVTQVTFGQPPHSLKNSGRCHTPHSGPRISVPPSGP